MLNISIFKKLLSICLHFKCFIFHPHLLHYLLHTYRKAYKWMVEMHNLSRHKEDFIWLFSVLIKMYEKLRDREGNISWGIFWWVFVYILDGCITKARDGPRAIFALLDYGRVWWRWQLLYLNKLCLSNSKILRNKWSLFAFHQPQILTL